MREDLGKNYGKRKLEQKALLLFTLQPSFCSTVSRKLGRETRVPTLHESQIWVSQNPQNPVSSYYTYKSGSVRTRAKRKAVMSVKPSMNRLQETGRERTDLKRNLNRIRGGIHEKADAAAQKLFEKSWPLLIEKYLDFRSFK